MPTSKINWFELLYFRGIRGIVALVIFCLVTSAFLGAFVPPFITEIARSYDEEHLFHHALLKLFILFVLVYLNRVLYQFGVNLYVRELIQNVRSFCYSRWLMHYDLQTSKQSKSERYPQGEVLARIMSDTEAVRELITSGTFGIIIDLFFVISCLISFVSMNTNAGSVLAIAQVLVAALLVWGSRYMRKIFLSVRKSSGEVSRTVANMVGGLKETFYTRHDNYASKRGEIVFEDYLKKQLHSNVWDASYYSVAESLYPLFLALIVFLFPYSGITEAALILAIVDLIQRSINPIKDIAGKVASVQRAATGFQRIGEFIGDLSLGHSSALQVNKASSGIIDLTVNISSFEYSAPVASLAPDADETAVAELPVFKAFRLQNIQFRASKGELIGLVGMSGSGKSTLLNIIAGNIVPDDCELKVSFHDESSLCFPGNGAEDSFLYRQQVGIVSQESHIFSESVLFNVTLQNSKPDDFDSFWGWLTEQLPYLKKWEMTPDTVLDQKTLSVGQKQLLAAIRSCYLKKSIVLFDEIASGLDSELELSLRRIILFVQKQALTFIVAHRLETVIGATRIIVLSDGKMVGAGDHQQLMNSSDVYQEFIAEMSPTLKA
jgi:ABC-type multidrug transport system fused ATPase/permease subunit